MIEWKKAKKSVEYREPEPNAHEWKYVGRTPQGGLSGGDDVYECILCGGHSYAHEWNGICHGEKKGKTEIVSLTSRWDSKKERAVLGKHIIIKDEDGLEVILIKKFKEYYEVE